MRIELTLQHRRRNQDVAVEAPADAHVGDIRAAARSLCGTSISEPLWHQGAVLPDDAVWSQVGLRNGSMVTTAPASTHAPSFAALTLTVVAGPNAGRSVPLARGRLVLGRDRDCDVVLDDPDTSRVHAAISIGPDVVTVRDLGSTNGSTLDGDPVGDAERVLPVGSRLRIGDNTISITGPDGAPAAIGATADAAIRVIRPPRRCLAPAGTVIELANDASPPRPHRVQWLTALLPAVAGGVLVWVTGSLQFLLFVLLSPAIILAGALGDRLHWRRSRRRAAVEASARAAATAAELDSALATELRTRRHRAPDPSTVAHIAGVPTDRVWERARTDDDLLVVRVGTGRLSSSTLTKRDGLHAAATEFDDAPICVDLREGPLGLAGPRRSVDSCARWIVGQLAALHSPADVRLVLLHDASTEQRWLWARWLPHLNARVVSADERSDLVDELASRLHQQAHQRCPDWTGPWTVLLVDRAEALDEAAGLSSLLESGPRIGLTALVLAGGTTALPSACVSVAESDGESATRLRLRSVGRPSVRDVVVDQVDPDWAERLARSLAPLVDPDPEDGIALPATCTLGEIHGSIAPPTIQARWRTSAGLARARVGIGTDGPVELDLTTDGPHTLIAGTTGAGKSEFLQALVAGLALDQSPAELNFLLVDYKGGAAFAECARLPHTAGIVTDLDAYLTSRALRSLRSELRRREGLFSEAGVTDLLGYRSGSGRARIPRLVIVVDEFATLAKELPDFVPGLVAVAQRGRSLGVHLVLATQRPGAAVSAEIRANTALRIALRTTDATESAEVIDAPVAATLARSTPGRAYLRTGTSMRCVQGVWPGARTTFDTDRIRVELLDAWRRPLARTAQAPPSTDLSRLADAVVEAATLDKLESAAAPWAPPLPRHLDCGRLPPPACATTVSYGLIDLPDDQCQEPSTLDLAEGESLLVVGAPRSGRTCALTSIALGAARQLRPDDLEIYAIDPRGSLSAAVTTLPHCATALGGHDPDTVLRLLTLLAQEDGQRPLGGTPRHDSAARLLLIDDWDSLLDTMADLDAATMVDHLLRLLRVAPAGRTSVVVAGGRTLMSPRLAAGFATRLALRLADVSDYAALGLAPREIPAPLPPGRAVRASDGAALQIAHPPVASTPPSVATTLPSSAVDQRPRDSDLRWPGVRPSRTAIRLRPLPNSLQLAELPSPAGPGILGLGVAGDFADPLSIDLVHQPARLIVAGPPRSGRSTVLRLLHHQARAAGMATIVAAAPRSPLAAEARAKATLLLHPDGDVSSLRAALATGHADARDCLDAFGEIDAPILLLVDDDELWVESAVGETLIRWLHESDARLSAVVAGRSDDLATTYRGIGALVRRHQQGILLRPGPVDGALLGVQLPRRPASGPPGRGIMVGDPKWDQRFGFGGAVPIQIADPGDLIPAADTLQEHREAPRTGPG